MLAKLRILHGRLQDKQGQNKRPEVKIRGPRFVIGSASDCSMCCRCGTVSDYHCEVRVEQHRVLVRTLSDEKGTFVNGALVERERILEAGDHLRIGRLEFEVLIDEPAPACSPGGDPRDATASDGVDEQFSDLLAEGDERERLRRRGNPELRLLHLESAAAETPKPQALAVDAARSHEPGKGTPRAKAEPGKLPVVLTHQIVAKDSTDAAQQALRKLFSRLSTNDYRLSCRKEGTVMVVRVGIVGMGFMGRMHLSGYRKLADAQVVAFADTDRNKRKGRTDGAGNLGDTSQEFDVKSFDKVYDSGFKLLADPHVDLVDICVPTCDHKDLFVAAVKAGKHVLCEKPMAVKPADVKAMVAAGKQAQGAVMIAQCIRFWPAYVLLKEYVDTKQLGKCKSVILRRQGGKGLWSPWYLQAAISGGAIYDLHVHDTDYVNFLFGKPTAVTSIGSVGGTTDKGVDHVVTNYHYPKNRVEAVTAIGAWHQHQTWPFYMGYTAVFERGTLDFDIQRPQPVMLYTDKSAEEIKVATTDGWFEEIKYLIDCISQGVPPALNPIASTADTMQIVQAEVRSVKSGKAEEVA